jgi:hypothetical protein
MQSCGSRDKSSPSHVYLDCTQTHTAKPMKFFSRFSRKATLANQFAKIVEDANEKTEREFGPVRDLIGAIISAVVECRDGIKPMIDDPDENKRQHTEVYIFNELVFFFMHLTLRMASGLLSQHEGNRLQEYLGPMMADLTVDSYCEHWPQEWKVKLKSEFFHNLNDSEKEYANCSRFSSPPPPEERSVQIFERLLNSIAERIAALLGRDSNPITVQLIIRVVLDAYQHVDLKTPIERFKRDSTGLPSYRAFNGA